MDIWYFIVFLFGFGVLINLTAITVHTFKIISLLERNEKIMWHLDERLDPGSSHSKPL